MFRVQSKFLMDDLAKNADDAINDARRVSWINWVNSEPLLTSFVDEDGAAYLFYVSDEIRNKVVLLDIWDYTLLPCRRSLSYVKEWHRRYGNAGLMIVGIHAPMFHFGSDKKNVMDSARALGITYPVVMDNSFEIWRSLENRFWPRRVLIDARGKTQADFVGEGGYDSLEKSIQLLLREVSPGLPCPPIMSPVRKIDHADYHVPMTTDDFFFGTRTNLRFGNEQQFKNVGEEVTFQPPEGTYSPDTCYLTGAWYATNESIYGSPANRGAVTITIPFMATDVYVIASSKARNPADVPQFTKVSVLIDRKTLPEENLGADLEAAEQRKTVVTVRDPRLYHVAKGLEHKAHELRFEIEATGTDTLELFAVFFEHNPV